MLNLSRKSIAAFSLAAAVLIGLVQPSVAGEAVNKTDGNVAILGYDSVAYFTEGRPVKGNSEFAYDWHDATWQFSNAEHRSKFAANPERYAPRYGGFCAGAMARGFKSTVDPEAWAIIDDKLYLNYSKQGIGDFAKNADSKIADADENWKKLGKAE